MLALISISSYCLDFQFYNFFSVLQKRFLFGESCLKAHSFIVVARMAYSSFSGKPFYNEKLLALNTLLIRTACIKFRK